MPLTISTVAMEEKNKIASKSVFFVALEITIPSFAETVKIASIDEDITWDGSVWQKFPININEIVETAGEVPKVSASISNVNRIFESYLQQYDAYCKENGYEPITVKLYVLNSLNLDDPTPEVTYDFTLEKSATSSEQITFELGTNNPYNRRCPQQRILKNQCRFIFKSTECGYSGGETSCNKTLLRCRELSNSSRYGGFPGVGNSGLRIA